MTWQFYIQATAFLFAAAIALGTAIVLWRRQAVPGRTPFVCMMLAVFVWTFFGALEAAALSPAAKIFLGKLEYFGIVSQPLFWFLFTMEYSRQSKWLNRRSLALLWIVPVITLILVFTSDLHGLIWRSILPGSATNANLIYVHGPWFYIHVVYSYTLIALGTIALFRDIIRFPHLYHRQIQAILLGAFFPWIGNLIYVLDISPVPGLDLTPFAFAISGVIYTIGVFGFQLLDLVPIARDALIEHMEDGVLVLDTQNRVADINPAAYKLLGLTTSAIGNPIELVLAKQPDLVTRYREAKNVQTEIFISRGIPRYLNLRITLLYDQQRRFNGRLMVFRDVTEHKHAEAQNQALLRVIPDLVLRFRVDGVCLACSSTNPANLNAPPKTYVGRNINESIPEEVAQTTLQNIREAIRTGRPQTYEYSTFVGDTERFFEGYMDACGPEEVAAIIRDVTEQRQLTVKLAQMSQHAQAQMTQIDSLQATLRDQAIREPLTGLFNRPYFVETLERELTRAMRDARPVSLVVIDIDALKAINDTHGPKAGNLIVQELANILRDQTRLADIACRFADEYVVVMPGAMADIARQRAEQWRLSFETLSIPFGNTQLRTTLSAGVAVFPFHGSTVESLLRAAENSLAAAKDAGCNRVVVWHV